MLFETMLIGGSLYLSQLYITHSLVKKSVSEESPLDFIGRNAAYIHIVSR